MMTSRIRYLAATGLLCGALTLSSVGSVFAAPLGDDPTPTAAATATTPSSLSGAKQHAAHLISKFLQPIAQFFGLSRVDLLKQLAQGQTLAQIAASYGKT